MLKDHAHFLSHQVYICLRVGYIDALESNRTGGRHFEQVQTAQKRAFARTGRTDDRNDVALVDGFGYTFQNFDFILFAERLIKILNFYHSYATSFRVCPKANSLS